ncbi:bifunctional diaminohydroxyphosphoribosylaminopyrimidine deaminase/5-amino-6-(5-phosphoribosylamino)uracil reductase RibD [Butyrivibrio sp. YAB3001]|uniref:bifunctional diaminohydroxyphosphoribosylaminopyrimidine deaminase/5-amino-6-(5-phosphoribosylamino)uracil reductase RibD n=1 Tax=Butyrivibrio sp. YAB3001 TaxID=1520812 RepID=UPI0008F63D03|nr:bifunctional diaminohydroxyphosphoribosylaminopyrimidine deaminase/5-amino-6-(5-phosphoribosylamino)uracil reductase RibD [Butyrivibrio sp. YAB3001]SFD08867.1 diaminohydroxyphosphoribosylaminopyrimidine deaminase / 5-amino-6-(5-phosphoribosylamino)uracil reductase [Butyrivibrio sp. YAB3001]
MNDEYYMRRAIELAKKGAGFVSPNPMVGAVIVKDGRIIAEGYHEKYGELHAERNALKNCSEDPKGASIYVTLEPCCHYGKTPPCTEAIIESGIKKVVVGTLDVNPIVAGKGVQILKEHGIEVIVGVLEDEVVKLNRIFNKYITTKLPYVVMKYAMTSDGKIATRTGASRWISCDESRRKVHEIRSRLTAIMVGVGTVKADDPLLTCRLDKEHKNPIRIICDTKLTTPLDAQVVVDAVNNKTIIATCVSDEEKIKQYENLGCMGLQLPEKGGVVDLQELMKSLGAMGIDSILLEGGATLNYSALKEKIVDEIQIFMAPKIFGGHAKTPVEGEGIDIPDNAIQLVTGSITKVGQDILIENEVVYQCSQE